MTAPPDVAATGLTEPAVRARVDAGQVNTVPSAPGRSLAQILRANDVQALKQADLGIAMGTGSQASRSVARVVLLDGTFAAISPMPAAFAVGLWVLVLVAGRPAMSRLFMIAAMAAGLVLLYAVPVARRVLALQLPPAGILAAGAGAVLAAILALTLWRRRGRVRSRTAARSVPRRSRASSARSSPGRPRPRRCQR